MQIFEIMEWLLHGPLWIILAAGLLIVAWFALLSRAERVAADGSTPNTERRRGNEND